MPRGVTTLETMVRDLRYETRRSANPNIGKDELPALKRILYRTQFFLYWDYDWPFLKVRRDITMAQDQRYYDFPDDMDFERIYQARSNGFNTWNLITRGITMEDYNIYDSDNGDTGTPVRKWDIIDAGSGEQMEVHPMPAEDGEIVRLDGFKKLGALTEDADVCTLDDNLIVLFAAANVLVGQDNNLAKELLAQANKLYLKMRAGAARRNGGYFVLGGEMRGDPYKDQTVIAVRNPT